MALVVKNPLPMLERPGFDPWIRKIPWRRAWQPTPVFLPGESHGQRSLVCCSPWGDRVRTQEASCLELGLCSSSGSQGPREGTPTCARFALLLDASLLCDTAPHQRTGAVGGGSLPRRSAEARGQAGGPAAGSCSSRASSQRFCGTLNSGLSADLQRAEVVTGTDEGRLWRAASHPIAAGWLLPFRR